MRITATVKEWFGYNRQERRASFILFSLIVCLILFRMFIPASKIVITDLEPDVLVSVKDNESSRARFFFDPNSASADTLQLAGFDEHETAILINYRQKGGYFRNPDDIRKLYGLDSLKASELIPYIKIEIPGSNDLKIQKAKIELNSCDSTALERLPGIGPVLSARIIKYRNLLGGFVSVNQLTEVYGLNEQTYILVSPMVYVDTSSVKKILINSAGYQNLIRMPYLSRYQVNAILKYRELTGSIRTPGELKDNLILPDSTLDKVRYYLDFSLIHDSISNPEQ